MGFCEAPCSIRLPGWCNDSSVNFFDFPKTFLIFEKFLRMLIRSSSIIHRNANLSIISVLTCTPNMARNHKTLNLSHIDDIDNHILSSPCLHWIFFHAAKLISTVAWCVMECRRNKNFALDLEVSTVVRRSKRSAVISATVSDNSRVRRAKNAFNFFI